MPETRYLISVRWGLGPLRNMSLQLTRQRGKYAATIEQPAQQITSASCRYPMWVEKSYAVEVIRDGTSVIAWWHDLSFLVRTNFAVRLCGASRTSADAAMLFAHDACAMLRCSTTDANSGSEIRSKCVTS